MTHAYLIRYGLMSRVGRFSSDCAGLTRGRAVVIRTDRGTELGEVLVPAAAASGAGLPLDSPTSSRLLRAAGPDDLERARQAEQDRPSRFAVCQKVVERGDWPLEILDAEPLLDDRRTVLHYLGPRQFDAAGLISALRAASDLDVMLEAVGADAADLEEPHDGDRGGGCGHCGSDGGGCGTAGGGGCGTGGKSAGGGCSDCGVKKLLNSSRSAAHR